VTKVQFLKGGAMLKLKAFAKKLKSQSGQGMAEYVLLIVVVVGVATIFKDKIKNMVSSKMESVSGEFNSFSQ
jgi:Putative Flagellin, Flp1-like, domain